MSWNKVRIGSFLKRRKDAIEIKNSVEYRRITIKTNHQGIFVRDTIKGSLIGTKLQFTVKAGQFLLSKIDARLGAFGIVPEFLEDGIITGNFWTFDFDKKKVNIDWFNLFTSSGNFYEICNRASSGTTHRKYLNETKFLNFEIDLPDFDEQNEFIKKYEVYNKNFKTLDSEIVQQKTHLQQLHQAILQDAVQGKLTKQNKDDEPADKLLQRIKAEKQKLIAAGKLKKEKGLPPITEDEISFELPKGWVWCRWNDLLSLDKYSMKRGPFGSSLKKEMFVDKGIRVFEQYNPINNDPYWSRYYITEKQYKELEAFTALPGDLLISCSGATLGRITELPQDAEFGIINQALLKLTLNIKVITNEYFLMLFRSPFLQEKIFDEAGGSAIPNMVGVSVLKQILLPLPPLSEQNRIVAQVKQLMQMINQLEQQVEQSQTQASQLLQIVLKESFSEKNKVYKKNELVTMAAEE